LSRIVGLLFALLVLVSSALAAAAPRGALVLRPRDGAAPLALSRSPNGFEGVMVVHNAGDGPLVVSRVTLRSDDDDPRTPPGLSITHDDLLPITLPPGASRPVKVEWRPGGRAKQLFGHVVVTSSDEERGEVALGVVAEPRRGLTAHVLALLVGLPLLGALLALAARRLRPDDARAAGKVGAGFAVAHAVLCGVVFVTFDPDLTRADGNDGLQLVERAAFVRSLGSEWFLGLDGSAAAMLPAIAAIAIAVVFGLLREDEVAAGSVASVLAAVAGLTGAILARDLLLLTALLALAFGGLVGAIACSRRDASAAATRAGVVVGVGLALFAAAAAVLHATSAPAFLLDGARATHHFAIAEMERTALVGKTVGPLPAGKTAFVLATGGVFALGAFFPLHTWLRRASSEADTPVVALVNALGPKIALVVLLRVSYSILPEAARWAEGPLVALGAVTVAYAGLLAVAERDWMRMSAHVTLAQSGLALASLAVATPQGVAGLVALLPAQAIAVSAAVAAVAAVEARTGTRDLAALGGLAGANRGLAAAVVASHAALAGLPGLSLFWGGMLAATALAPAHFTQLVIAGVGAVVLGGALAHALRRAVLGELPRATALLAARDGRLAPLEAAEIAILAPLLALLVAGCFYPHPLLACAASAARHAAAW